MNLQSTQNKYGILAGLLLPIILTSLAYAEGMSGERETVAKFNDKGELIRPTGYREWIYVGAPLTPNDMNNGKAAFPEFHNVYIDKAAWEHWKKTGEFKEGTVIVKELLSVGSKKTFSGNGYFMGDYQGLEAMVKDSKRFAEQPGGWAFFRFTVENSKALKTTAAIMPANDCAGCHQPNAQKDSVFIQHYPVLREATAGR